ncbi:MAG: hypothetical protein WC549_00065 [Actinomycetota bacterium]
MTPEIIAKITDWLNKLPAVKWDRMNEKKGHLYVFGWIDRNDTYKDFFLIDFIDGEPVDYCSSNVLYNHPYRDILGLYTEQCKRIEAILPDVKNAVKLEI